MSTPAARGAHPLGAAVSLDELDRAPHAVHHRLRAEEPVSWLPCLNGWLVTSHALAARSMHDAEAFTVDDPRFSTARVIGPSMLSLDGTRHAAHRAPFVGPFRVAEVRGRFADEATHRARELLQPIRAAGRGELRRGFAGPMSAAIVVRALGMAEDDAGAVLADYDEIVASVTAISAGQPPTEAGTRAAERLRGRLAPVIDGRRGDSLLAAAARASTTATVGAAAGPGPGATADPHPDPSPGATASAGRGATAGTGPTAGPGPAGVASGLGHDAIASNAAVLLFGGIETTEGMIANAAVEILRRPGELERLRGDPDGLDAIIDESLRLEPAAAVVDRYATRDVTLGGAAIAAGDLVRISITAANRDPSIFEEPDRWAPSRLNARRHLAFAQGPHVCVGVHLARLEARSALARLISLPGLRPDPDRPPPRIRGLIFRKPDAVWVRCDARAGTVRR